MKEVILIELDKLDIYGEHCYIPEEEADSIYEEIVRIHKNHLAQYNVSMPTRTSNKGLQLIFLYKYKEFLVHRDSISEYVHKENPKAMKDQQTRHLAAAGWYILLRNEVIPGTGGKKVESGYHYFYDIQTPKPTFMREKLKRLGRMAAGSFEELIITYNNKCATCGAENGKKHPQFTEKIVSLQQGHMDPKKPLDLKNTIPQCQMCNQIYLNNFVFDENGYIKSIHNPDFIKRSDEAVRRKIYQMLKLEFK